MQVGIMIAIIIIIRTLAINCFPKKTFIILWGIVLLRLVIPYSLPTPFSAYPLVNLTELNQYVIREQFFNLKASVSLPQVTEYSILHLLIVLVWGVGVILCSLYFIVTYVSCQRHFADSQPVKNEFVTKWLSLHILKRPISIRQSSYIISPVTYGIFHPVILMPIQTDWTDTKGLRYILEHEYIHIRHFDIASKILLTIILCFHWFNPFIWVMYILANQDIELFCDESVVHFFGKKNKSEYALTLLSMEEQKKILTPFCNSFRKNAIEERIEAIMKTKDYTFFTFLLTFLICVGLTVFFTTSTVASTNHSKFDRNCNNMTIDRRISIPNLTGNESKKAKLLLNNIGCDYITFFNANSVPVLTGNSQKKLNYY